MLVTNYEHYYHCSGDGSITDALSQIPYKSGYYVNTVFGLFVFPHRGIGMLEILEKNDCEVVQF